MTIKSEYFRSIISSLVLSTGFHGLTIVAGNAKPTQEYLFLAIAWVLILGITPINILKKQPGTNADNFKWCRLIFIQLNMFFGAIAGSAYGIVLSATFFAYVYLVLEKLHLLRTNPTILVYLILGLAFVTAFVIAAYSSYWYCEGSILYLERKSKSKRAYTSS